MQALAAVCIPPQASVASSQQHALPGSRQHGLSQPAIRQHGSSVQGVSASSPAGMPLIHQVLKLVPGIAHARIAHPRSCMLASKCSHPAIKYTSSCTSNTFVCHPLHEMVPLVRQCAPLIISPLICIWTTPHMTCSVSAMTYQCMLCMMPVYHHPISKAPSKLSRAQLWCTWRLSQLLAHMWHQNSWQ
jgi:hypothetical protein